MKETILLSIFFCMELLSYGQFGKIVHIDNVRSNKILILNDFDISMKVKLVNTYSESEEKLLNPGAIEPFNYKCNASTYSSTKIIYKYDIDCFRRDTANIGVNELFNPLIKSMLKQVLCPENDPNYLECLIARIPQLQQDLSYAPATKLLTFLLNQLKKELLQKDDEIFLQEALGFVARNIMTGYPRTALKIEPLVNTYLSHRVYVKGLETQIERQKSMAYQLEIGSFSSHYKFNYGDNKQINAPWTKAPSFEIRIYKFFHGKETYQWPLTYLTMGLSRGLLMFSPTTDTVFRKDLGISYYHSDLKLGLYPSINYNKKILVSINIELGVAFNFRNEYDIKVDSIKLLSSNLSKSFEPESVNLTALFGLVVGYKKIMLRVAWVGITSPQMLFNKNYVPLKACNAFQASLSFPILSRNTFRYKWRDKYTFRNERPDR